MFFPRKPDLWLAILVLGLHTYVLVSGLKHGSFLIDDSIQYLSLAENLFEGNGFSQAYAAPYIPDLQRTPVYPLVMGLLGRSPFLILLLQHLLVLLSGWLLFRALKLRFGAQPARLGAWGWLLQPYPILFGSLFLSEALFIFFLVWAGERLLFFLASGKALPLGVGLLALSLGALTRPVAFPLVLLTVVLCFGGEIRKLLFKREASQRGLIRLGILLLLPAMTLGPWMLRNQAVSGRLTFNTMPDMGFLHGRWGGLEAHRKGRSFEEHELYMAGDSMAALELGLPALKSYYSESSNHESELYHPSVRGLTISAFFQDFPGAVSFQLKCMWQMLRGVGYGWGKKVLQSDFQASVLAGWQLGCNLFMYLGCLLAVFWLRRWDRGLWGAVLWAGLVVLASAAAFSDGRYRMVIDPLLVFIAVSGFSFLRSSYNFTRWMNVRKAK